MNSWWMKMVGAKLAIGVVALLSVGAVAAAAGEIGSDPVVPTAAPTTTTTSTTEPVDTPTTTEVTPDPTVPEEPDGGTVVPESDPAAECMTHGAKVSAVAHATPPGPGHGAAVSAAAHDHDGECNRVGDVAEPPASTDDADDADDADVEHSDGVDDEPSASVGDGGSHGRGHGSSGHGTSGHGTSGSGD